MSFNFMMENSTMNKYGQMVMAEKKQNSRRKVSGRDTAPHDDQKERNYVYSQRNDIE